MPFIQQEMAHMDVTFIPTWISDKQSYDDWAARVWASCFSEVTSDWLLILQQDSLIHNPTLLEAVLTDQYSLVCRHEGRSSGMHWTCGCQEEGDQITSGVRCELDFLLLDMRLARKTSLDISVSPGLDHGGKWTKELKKMCPNFTTLHRLGFHMPKDYEHLRAFIESYRWVLEGRQDGYYNKPRFIQYNKNLLNVIHEVNVHPVSLDLIKKAASLGE